MRISATTTREAVAVYVMCLGAWRWFEVHHGNVICFPYLQSVNSHPCSFGWKQTKPSSDGNIRPGSSLFPLASNPRPSLHQQAFIQNWSFFLAHSTFLGVCRWTCAIKVTTHIHLHSATFSCFFSLTIQRSFLVLSVFLIFSLSLLVCATRKSGK